VTRARLKAVEVFERPWWVEKARCRGRVDPEFFYPVGRGVGAWQAGALRLICADCQVRAHCLEWAIEHREWGIWAGTTEECRQNLRRITCPECRAELDPVDVWHGRVALCEACMRRMNARTSTGRRARQSWRMISRRAS
jgi:WhiB family redox-sensing transcriptional regulator